MLEMNAAGVAKVTLRQQVQGKFRFATSLENC